MSRTATSIFGNLDTRGRFHRDTPIGRLLHPGAVSYRQISATDSLHLSVTGDNRICAHIDRVSPVVQRGRRSRYSICRAAVHTVLAGVEGLGRLVRGQRGAHNCHLDCEIVWVPDNEDEAEPAVRASDVALADDAA